MRTSKLTPEAALEILTQSFRLVEEAGFTLEAEVVDGMVMVSLHNVDLKDGLLVPVTPKAVTPFTEP